MPRSSYQPVHSFTSADIPLSTQGNHGPPPIPDHQDRFQRSGGKNDRQGMEHPNGPGSYYEPNAYPHYPPPSPHGYPPPQQGVQQPYYNYGPSTPQVVYASAPEDKRPPWKRALLGPVRIPIFSYTSALVMLVMLIYEFVRNHQLTGNVIQNPSQNIMIGPSFSVLVNIGAKFLPCIRPIPEVSDGELYQQCFKDTDTCTLATMCGFPTQDTIPNQAFRFVSPVFMHAGVVHYIINMLTHLRLGVDLERALGVPRYVFLYMCSGIFGFVLSASLASKSMASMGCSGALFGLIGYMFVDVLVNWKYIDHPVRELMVLLISTVVSLVLGLLPGLDNFAHIGGFVTGLVMGMLIAPMRPNPTRNVKIITWACRIIALVILVVMFAVGISQFYASPDPSQICPNCKYLSCLPVNGWCDSY
ncbi:rhomboid-domain-containing protein [Hesseltinella vesiculosa]|uniref:Rhomboid-type serine protease n=1 Tax=Hesseltinella vesiculosa TaxID=101127 RepID=A0A1X2G6V1_9FUNG|nr:rhomboid-domain-containing protein [Hesseltinella vesiculosa]